ncbi:MAG: phosphatidate cytidylyltransferase [Gemmatimonadota bacterium]
MSELSRRVLVAVIAVPVVIGAIWGGGWWLVALLSLVGGVGAWELFRIAAAGGVRPLTAAGVLTAAAIPVYVRLVHDSLLREPGTIAAVALLALLGGTLWTHGVAGRPLLAMSVTLFGVVYAGGLLSFGYLLRHHRFAVDAAAGTALLLYPVIVTWASDTAAYFVGRRFGRSRLMPSVSPGKTVAGAVGAMVGAAAVSILWNNSVLPGQAQLAMNIWSAAAFGVVISGAAQIGDLVESMFKREAGVKDSSNVLPGHGGILDRLDALYFTIPVAYLLLGSLLRPASP